MRDHFVSASCIGETCNMCNEPASHKAAEVIQHDNPYLGHEWTAYLCCTHFSRIFGWAAKEVCLSADIHV